MIKYIVFWAVFKFTSTGCPDYNGVGACSLGHYKIEYEGSKYKRFDKKEDAEKFIKKLESENGVIFKYNDSIRLEKIIPIE